MILVAVVFAAFFVATKFAVCYYFCRGYEGVTACRPSERELAGDYVANPHTQRDINTYSNCRDPGGVVLRPDGTFSTHGALPGVRCDEPPVTGTWILEEEVEGWTIVWIAPFPHDGYRLWIRHQSPPYELIEYSWIHAPRFGLEQQQ